jgi:hypothetical protein
MKNAVVPSPSVSSPFVTCENKRMGAMQFDYDGSTLTFPPGRFVTDEAIARSAESRLSPADFQIVHEAPRTAAEAVAANPDLIGRGSNATPPAAPPAPRGQGTETSPPPTAPKPPKTRAQAPKKGSGARKPKE